MFVNWVIDDVCMKGSCWKHSGSLYKFDIHNRMRFGRGELSIRNSLVPRGSLLLKQRIHGVKILCLNESPAALIGLLLDGT
jgi:hypothetical protein